MVRIGKNGFRGVVFKGVYGLKHGLLRIGFFILPAGEISGIFCKFFWLREKFPEEFFEMFLEIYFWQRKLFLIMKNLKR